MALDTITVIAAMWMLKSCGLICFWLCGVFHKKEFTFCVMLLLLLQYFYRYLAVKGYVKSCGYIFLLSFFSYGCIAE